LIVVRGGFFVGGQDLNFGLCVYYVLFLPIELSSRGRLRCLNTLQDFSILMTNSKLH